MKIWFDRGLVEESVFLEVRRRESLGDARALPAYHRSVDRLYELPEGDLRDRLFGEACLEFFRDFGFEACVRDGVMRCKRVAEETPVFVHPASPRQACADLLVDGSERNTAIRIPPERFLDLPALERFLDRELCRVEDLLDPAFGYDPASHFGNGEPGRVERENEAFRALWDLSVLGRLFRRGRPAADPESAIEEVLVRLAGTVDPSIHAIRAIQAILLGAIEADHPKHSELVERGKALVSLAAAIRDGLAPDRRTGRCPICRFPTHDWVADPFQLPPPVRLRLRSFRQDWTEESGVCGQCALLARAQAASEPPAVSAAPGSSRSGSSA
jgi:hypothetical protein